MAQQLFVYGTLRQQASHGHMLPGSRTPATTLGRLIGLPEGYPALVDSPDGRVVGECVTVEDHQWPELDAYEEVGNDILQYCRRPRLVYIDGQEYSANCYMISVDGERAWLARGAYPIPSGDWLESAQ